MPTLLASRRRWELRCWRRPTSFTSRPTFKSCHGMRHGSPRPVPGTPSITLPNWSKARKRMLPHAVNFEHARLIGPVGASPVSPGRANLEQ
eukprot:s2712_g6.t1